MKKIILLVAVSVMFACTMQSCSNNNAKQSATENTSATTTPDSTSAKTATADTSQTSASSDKTKKTMYECPMKCGNKLYDKPGKCPECGMTLVPVKS